MRYMIEYSDGRNCNFAEGRKELIKKLSDQKSEAITDIRKIYKNGISDSVKDSYEQYIYKGK